ncbi:NAD(+) synthase [Pendulispora albinea]|uniref:Glutamine-dependent NAD(+) synthetase n=1 Tax=Pendulispora albinea TaxID=2741071 RepID=A0ABZ2LT69_9BACT
MRLVRIAIGNANTTVGAVKSNVDRAIELAHAAAGEGATLLALPEQLIGGYMQEDLVQWRSFIDAQRRELDRFAHETRALGTASVLGLTVARGSHLYSVAALVHGGQVHGMVPKEKLPTYGVFYENRTLARGTPGLYDDLPSTGTGTVPFGDLVFEMDFGTIGLEVCEDIWSPDGPMRRRCYAGAEIMVNVSASPFRLGVEGTRREIISTRSSDNQCTVVYAALVGANDGLIYDGGGYVAQNGRMLHYAPRYREGITCVTVDLDRTRRLRAENTTWRMDQETFEAANVGKVRRVVVSVPTRGRNELRYPGPAHKSFFLPEPSEPRSPRADFCEDLLDALALGVGDYFEKTGAFKTIGVALSGGRDSLLCLMLAHRWLLRRHAHEGDHAVKKRVAEVLRAFFMPTRYSSAETRSAAEVTARELGVPLVVSDIDDAFERELEAAKGLLQPGETVTALTRQNIQARLRAERMWSWSNSASGLFLQTSNMSEKAVGYTTIGGDMEGALSVIANVPKTVVNYLLDYLLETTGSEAIRLTLKKPASAELADDMEDERDLMPFPVLDACFALYAGEKMNLPEVASALESIFPEENPTQLEAWAKKFGRLFTQSIYKWVEMPLSLHVGNLDLERERALQLPVVQKTEWQ